MSPRVTCFVSSCSPTNIAVIRKSDECNNRHYHCSVSSIAYFYPLVAVRSSGGVIYRRATATARCCPSQPIPLPGFSMEKKGIDGGHGSIMFPLRQCKILHLVRHAQGIHNVAAEKDHSAYFSEEYFDAHLTSLGWNQVDNLHRHVIASGLAKKIDLVITSPLLRAMQTAVGVFGGDGFVDGAKGLPLMIENAGNCGRPGISCVECLPFIAVEACRERLGVHPCDRRRTISEYQTLFPSLDFSLIESNEDNLWKPDVREANEDVADRGIQFINWLWTRKEKEIAIVTHSGFLFQTLKKFSKDFHPLIKDEISKYFANCELRSVVLVDNRFIS